MRYAISVADLQYWALTEGEFAAPLILLAPILTDETVKVESTRIDADGVLVSDEVDPERWSAIMELIRNVWKLHKNRHLRIYESETGRGSWKRI